MERRRSRRASLEVDPQVIASLDPELVPFMHRSLERRYQMEDPVVAKDGHTYEREAIEAYITTHGKSPINGQPMDIDSLIENRAVQSQIDGYHEVAERAERFEEHATDDPEHQHLSQTLTEADRLAAQKLYQEAANVYARLTRGLQAQLTRAAAGEAKTAILEKIWMIKQRQAGVEANREESSVLAAPLIEAQAIGTPDTPLDRVRMRTGSTSSSISLDGMRTTTADFEDTGSSSCSSTVALGPPGIELLLNECSQQNFESEGEEEPVKGKSIWLKYNAGRRRGQWREVWPCNDSATPPWIPNAMGTAPYFRGMEADDIDIHHGRTTKYLLHLVLEVSETLPAGWNDSPLHGTLSSASAMTDDGDFAGMRTGSPPAEYALQSLARMHPEPEAEPKIQPPVPQPNLAQSSSPVVGRRQGELTLSPAVHLMRGSARDLLRHHDVPDHVADMLEAEDIHTPQTLVDLDEAMVTGLDLKLGERIKLTQAIKHARTLSQQEWSAAQSPASPKVQLEAAAGGTPRLSDLLDLDTPTANATDVRYQEAYQGFRKASDIADIGEIKIEEYLSKGTSGTVCKAQWRGMSVAVKRFYYVEDDQELVSSFENEVFFMRELQHQNLIRFFAAQCKPPDLCIVMELMLGSLSDLLYGKLSKGVEETLKPRRQLSIIKGIAGGMHFLHDHGICHRDLKSANVLFNRHLDVKLCDFAFSKFKQQASVSARFETSVGTPAWMAPEVLRGDEYTLLADVYSFGVIIWEIICREAPFNHLNRFQIIFQVGTQGVLLKLPSDTAPIWVAIANACWREKPPTVKSRRPKFRQIVDVLTATQEEMKAGQPLSDGCGMKAWEAEELKRETEYAREMSTVGAEAQPLGNCTGIAEDPCREAEAATEEATEHAASVPPADPDALRPADVPLARVGPRRALSASVMRAPPPESPRGDGA